MSLPDLNRNLLADHRPMKVTPHDRNTFMVCSEAKPGTLYLVDMSDPHWKHGRCSCTDFQVRIEAPILRNERPERWFCKHIRAVLHWIIDQQQYAGLERVAELPEGEPTPP